MTKSRSFLLVIVSLVAVNAASFLTLEHNLSASIYPIDADSIGLPLIGGVITTLQLLVLLAVAILLPKCKLFGPAVSVVLCGLAGLLSVQYAVLWAVPHHYTMAAAYGGVLVVCGYLAASYASKFASNFAVKRDAQQATRPLP
jgi:hypothetical protein